jgi:outer membrane protein OmpA-like peptidoglycan-associated protein
MKTKPFLAPLLAGTALPLMLIVASPPAVSAPVILAQATVPDAAQGAPGQERRRERTQERPDPGERPGREGRPERGERGPPERTPAAEERGPRERPERPERPQRAAPAEPAAPAAPAAPTRAAPAAEPRSPAAAEERGPRERPGQPGQPERPQRAAPAEPAAPAAPTRAAPAAEPRAPAAAEERGPRERPDRPQRAAPAEPATPAAPAQAAPAQTAPARPAPAQQETPQRAAPAAPATPPAPAAQDRRPERPDRPERAGPPPGRDPATRAAPADAPAQPADPAPTRAAPATPTPAAPPAAAAPAGAPTAAPGRPPGPPAGPPVAAPGAPPPQPGMMPRPGFAEPRSPDFERMAPGIAGRGEGARMDDLRRTRRERVEDGGRRVIIEEPDRFIVREGDRYIVRHNESDRFRRSYRDADVRVERRGREIVEIVRRPDGFEIVTVRDADGNLLRRVRRGPGGRETVLIENFREGPRRGMIIEEVIVAPPQVRIPRERYVVELEGAGQEEIYEALTAPPVARLERRYTLDEVRQSRNLREHVRRVDVDTVTFEFGSWRLAEDEIPALTGVAQAIRRALDRNPDEIFLIEGHTDAVGSEVDNLTLSDRRAETVAMILSERFGIPAENLTTQGYGEQFLKVDTQAAERRNRRVEVRRITPLLQGQS